MPSIYDKQPPGEPSAGAYRRMQAALDQPRKDANNAAAADPNLSVLAALLKSVINDFFPPEAAMPVTVMSPPGSPQSRYPNGNFEPYVDLIGHHNARTGVGDIDLPKPRKTRKK